MHISKIHGYDTPALTEAQIAEKIHAAIGAKPISEGAAGKKSAVIANNYFKPAEANCAYTPEVIASLKDGGSFVLAANSPFGPCVHFLYDKWGHSAPGGMMWSGCYTKGKNMAHAVVFAEHTVKGMRDPWSTPVPSTSRRGMTPCASSTTARRRRSCSTRTPSARCSITPSSFTSRANKRPSRSKTGGNALRFRRFSRTIDKTKAR